MTAALLTFVATATLLIVAPGPDSLLVTRNVVRGGQRSGLATAAGTVTGLAAWSVAAALGLSALLAASRLGYDMVRITGGIYLIWLGVQGLRSRATVVATPAASQPAHRVRTRLARTYLTGIMSNLLNPKIGIFFVALLPGFIPAGAPVTATAALLGALFVVETWLWLVALVWLIGRSADQLNRPAVRQWIDRITGLVLIGFGLGVATESR